MARFVSSTLLSSALSALLLVPSLGLAQLKSPEPERTPAQKAAPQTTANSPILAPKEEAAQTAAPRRQRAISGGVAAALAAATPKYTPPPPEPERPPESERPDMREIDRPMNSIIRLPDYVVRDRPPPVLNERTISTDKGLADIAVRRYISDLDQALNRFTLPLFGSSYRDRAITMYEEQERLNNMARLESAAEATSVNDPEAGAYIRREARETFLRSSDFGWQNRNQ